MKDTFGKELREGDLIAYVERLGSTVNVKQRLVVSVEARSCKVAWDSSRYDRELGKFMDCTNVTTLKTPNLIVLLGR